MTFQLSNSIMIIQNNFQLETSTDGQEIEKMDAVLELKHYSTERLLDLWEMTTTNSDHNIPAVRGWLMDEIERRFPEAFEKWLGGDAEGGTLRKFIKNEEV